MINFKRLLSTDSPKAVKSIKYGFLNGIHYMAAYTEAGVGNMCVDATQGCIWVCLGKYSGQAAMVADLENDTNSVRESRINKAVMFMKQREVYMAHLEKAIASLVAKASKNDLIPCVRLNGSTDVAFERMRYGPDRKTLIERFPNVQFVEYTKSLNRMMDSHKYSNVHFTFSRSESNEDSCLKVLAAGYNVAIVFGGPLPETWNGYRVIDGDKHDLRHLDDKNVVVGLSPKGQKAKRDTSGFVLRDYVEHPMAMAA